jgi:GT2 family glycosyltransferase
MKLRIITATQGQSPFLSEAVSSINEARPESEHVIICPAARVHSIVAGSGAVILPEASTGLYAALNQGWRAPGEWDAFTWLNDDDWLLAPGFGRLLEALARWPEVDVAYGRVRLIGAKGETLGTLPVARRGEDLAALLARGIMPLAQPGTVIRRGLIERLGGFDETFRSAGDLDFFTRALMTGARFEFINAWVASFRLHPGQLSKRRAEVETETARALQPFAGASRNLAALLRFRLGNAGAYCDRVRRHGFVPMSKLYDRTE